MEIPTFDDSVHLLASVKSYTHPRCLLFCLLPIDVSTN